MNPLEARRRIDAIRADRAHPFFAEGHPQHGRAVRDMAALYAQAYPEPSVENPLDQPMPVNAPPPADPGLKHREPGVFWQESAPIPRAALEAEQAADQSARQWWQRKGQQADEEISRRWKNFLLGSPSRKPMTFDEVREAALSSANANVAPAVREQTAARIREVLWRDGKLPDDGILPQDVPLPRWEDRQNPSWITGGFILDRTGDVVWVDRHQPEKFLDDLEGATSRPSLVGRWNSETREQGWHNIESRRHRGMPADGRPSR